MREIKFRGKRTYNEKNKSNKGEWIFGSLRINKKNNAFIVPTNVLTEIEVDRETIGQYTGLHDKNGKEIYEGDIIKVKFGKVDIGKVIYEHCEFTIDVMNMDRPYGRVSFINNFMEVIGNIYDNPELLESEE